MATIEPKPERRANDARRRARNADELLDLVEARTRRRIAGGLISLHRRGHARFGAAWTPLACVGVGASLFGAWRVANGAAFAVGALALSAPQRAFDSLARLGFLQRLTRR